MKKYISLTVVLLFVLRPCFSQFGMQTELGLSHSGYAWFLDATYQKRAHCISLGPKVLLSDAATPTSGPWGFRIAYRFTLLDKERLSSFTQLSYQLTWLEVYNPNQLPNDKQNLIHEGHFSYGFQYKIGKGWYIQQSIGVGGYLERLVDLIGDKISNNNGFSAWIGIGGGKRF